MKTLRIRTVCSAAILSLTLCGCVVALGNKGEGQQPRATRGQELIDLKKALETGAINPDEYELQKKKLMENSGK